MNMFVILEFDKDSLMGALLNTMTVAMKCCGEIHMLIAALNVASTAHVVNSSAGGNTVLYT